MQRLVLLASHQSLREWLQRIASRERRPHRRSNRIRIARPAISTDIAPVHRRTKCGGHSSFRCCTRLATSLLTSEHLLPQDFLDHPKVVRLAVHDVLQILDIPAEFIYLPIVESFCIAGRLLNVEARAYVYYHMLGICEFAGNVE